MILPGNEWASFNISIILQIKLIRWSAPQLFLCSVILRTFLHFSLYFPLIPVCFSEVMLLVDPGVYIGTAADLNDCQALTAASVTHILSVESVDPGPQIPATGNFIRKWINALDEETTDLLSYLDACNIFIDEAVKGGGATLVHW